MALEALWLALEAVCVILEALWVALEAQTIALCPIGSTGGRMGMHWSLYGYVVLEAQSATLHEGPG